MRRFSAQEMALAVYSGLYHPTAPGDTAHYRPPRLTQNGAGDVPAPFDWVYLVNQPFTVLYSMAQPSTKAVTTASQLASVWSAE